MQIDIHKPIKHNNQSSPKEKGKLYKVIAFILGIGLIFIGAATYLTIIDTETWYAYILFFVIGLLFLFGAFIFFIGLKYEDEYERHFEMNEDGIFIHHMNHKSGTEDKISIPFESIQRVIVGNNANFISMPRGKGISFFRFGALMVIQHENGIYIEEFFDVQKFHDWVARFQDKKCPMYQTEYDLRPARGAGENYEVDFSKLEGEPAEQIYTPPIGEEKTTNPFLPWEDGVREREGVEERRQNRTKKWEKRVVWLLFGYALIAGGIIMPLYPLDEDGFLLMDSFFVIGVLFVYVLTPLILVYWRAYTKWYMPLVYFFVVIAGNSIAVFLVSLFAEIPSLYLFIISINIAVLWMGWIPALLFVKASKLVFPFLYKERERKRGPFA